MIDGRRRDRRSGACSDGTSEADHERGSIPMTWPAPRTTRTRGRRVSGLDAALVRARSPVQIRARSTAAALAAARTDMTSMLCHRMMVVLFENGRAYDASSVTGPHRGRYWNHEQGGTMGAKREPGTHRDAPGGRPRPGLRPLRRTARGRRHDPDGWRSCGNRRVTRGKQAIVDQIHATAGAAGGDFQVKDMFGDDKHVCVVGKVIAQRFPGNQYLQAGRRPYATYSASSIGSPAARWPNQPPTSTGSIHTSKSDLSRTRAPSPPQVRNFCTRRDHRSVPNCSGDTSNTSTAPAPAAPRRRRRRLPRARHRGHEDGARTLLAVVGSLRPGPASLRSTPTRPNGRERPRTRRPTTACRRGTSR